MAPFTDDPAAATLHLLTLGGVNVPLKREEREAWLMAYAQRLMPNLVGGEAWEE